MASIRAIFIVILLFSTLSVFAQKDGFPKNLIHDTIIEHRGLSTQVDMLMNQCDWSQKEGRKIDIKKVLVNEEEWYAHVYEYFFDCDNLRIIYFYDNPMMYGTVQDLAIENLEDDSEYVSSPRLYLKNKKKYAHYFTGAE